MHHSCAPLIFYVQSSHEYLSHCIFATPFWWTIERKCSTTIKTDANTVALYIFFKNILKLLHLLKLWGKKKLWRKKKKKSFLYIIWQVYWQLMAVGWVDKEPWNNRRQMQIYVSSFSLLYVWSCPRFPQAKHTKSSLAGAQLLIVNVCPLAKRALIGRGGDVSCLCCSRGKFNLIWAVVSTLACRSQATSPTLVVVEQRVRGGGVQRGHWNWILFHYA